MKIGFLFGAGISVSCGTPTTDRLTDMVLRARDVHRYSDGTYFLSRGSFPGVSDHEDIGRIQCFLAFLKSHADDFFGRRKERVRIANYEDLYYLVTQLADAVDEYENPAVSKLLEDAEGHFVRPLLPVHSSFRSDALFEETRQYIKGIVTHALSAPQPAQNHLRQVVEAAADRTVTKLEIFTLNHDLLVERTLERAGIAFSDGFARLSHDLRCWDRRRFAKSRRKVRLTKLHGSVNWYPLQFLSRGPSRVCIATNGDINHARGPEGRPPRLLHDHPEMLIGTFNKMLEYTMGIYADLFCVFRMALWHLDKLVVSGYAFGDKGINATISEWIRQDCGRRLLIIAPHASRYRHTARGAIRLLFSECGTQITLMNKAFEKASWQQIRSWCGKRS